ncbi:MAG: hypothetical protein U1E45_03940 [Geminicoccaceae bacterium]
MLDRPTAADYFRVMTEPTDHTLALLRRMDAKLYRIQSDVTDLRGRLQRVEGRLTSVDARLGVLRLARIEDVIVLAEPQAE